jgi:hypothetical protein
MPMADNRRSRLIRRRQLQSAPVARPRRRRIEFFFDHRLMKPRTFVRRPVSTGSADAIEAHYNLALVGFDRRLQELAGIGARPQSLWRQSLGALSSCAQILRRPRLHAAAHIGVTRRDPDPDAVRKRDQERSALKVAAISEAEALVPILTCAPPSSTTIGAASVHRDRRCRPGSLVLNHYPRIDSFMFQAALLTAPFVEQARADVSAPPDLRHGATGEAGWVVSACEWPYG